MGEKQARIDSVESKSAGGHSFWSSVWSVDGRREAALWLWSRRGVSVDNLRRLVEAEALAEWGELEESRARAVLEEAGMTADRAAKVVASRPGRAGALSEWAASVEHDTSQTITAIGEEDYPDRLYDLADPPGFVFSIGDLTSVGRRAVATTLAVVGSRKIPAQTGRWVEGLVSSAAERGVIVVSGGALGADAMAHRAAMMAGRPTVSVMPCSVSEPRPRTNSAMFRQIIQQGGALVGEYPPGTGVRSFHYPRRNRLIAALGDGTLVLRAGAESGTMLTARAAQAIERPLGAVPGRPGDSLVAGCHQLLAEDAVPVTSTDEIFERLLQEAEPEDEEAARRSPGAEFDASEPTGGVTSARPCWPEGLSEEGDRLLKNVVEQVENGEDRDNRLDVSVDDLAQLAGVEAGVIQSAMLEWELAGIVQRNAGDGRVCVRLPELGDETV